MTLDQQIDRLDMAIVTLREVRDYTESARAGERLQAAMDSAFDARDVLVAYRDELQRRPAWAQ